MKKARFAVQVKTINYRKWISFLAPNHIGPQGENERKR